MVVESFSFLRCLFCEFGVFCEVLKKESVLKAPIYYTTSF